MSKGAHEPDQWHQALARADAAPRCGARRKATGQACRAPAMVNGRCHKHGGASTGPRTAGGKARCAAASTKHGQRNAEARARAARRGEARTLVAALRRLAAVAS